MYVNVYFVDRRYGGSEEGGWYYDSGEVVTSVEVESEDKAKEVKATLKEEYSNEGRRPAHSVLFEGEYRVLIQDEPAKNFPSETPYYC